MRLIMQVNHGVCAKRPDNVYEHRKQFGDYSVELQ